MCSRRPSLAAVASLLFLSSGCVRAVVAEGTLHALLGGTRLILNRYCTNPTRECRGVP